jgi:hypothetical protein
VMAGGWQAIESQLGWCKYPRPDIRDEDESGGVLDAPD